MNPKVSVIIPVWNPGDGISRCVASLRNQTLRDIEMIFVDDCGTDGSMDVVRVAAAEDPRIRIIVNSENLGLGYTLNKGLEAARGEYISVVDPDDYVNPCFLEKLYSKAVANNLDIVKGKHVYVREDGSIVGNPEQNDVIHRGLSAGKPLFFLFHYQHQSAIYRHSLLKDYGILFGTSRRAQDTTFLLKVCHRAKTFDMEDSAEYYFCERRESLMHDMHPHTLERQLHAFSEKMDYIVNNMTDEKLVSKYVSEQLVFLLMMADYYGKMAKCKDDVQLFVRGLREQLSRFSPQEAERMKSECFIVRVLCDYDVILARRPFRLPWGNFRVDDYIETLTEWMDFITSHPDCVRDAEGDLYRLFRETDGLRPNEKNRVRLLKLARRLPLRQRTYIHEMTTLPRSFAMEAMVKMLGGYRRLRHLLQLETK